MQKMGLLRNVLKTGQLIRVGHQNARISSFLGDSPRAFSTAGGTTTQDSSSIPDPFLQTPTAGLCYGALSGITGHTTKNDILNLLEDSDLKPEDLKVEYLPDFSVNRMLIQFPSRKACDTAVRALGRKSRGYRFGWIHPDFWAKKPSYDGKALLLQGIPHNAVSNDIERLLSGCHHMDMSIRFINRESVRMAIVQFPSAILARLAFLTTNKEFTLNNQVLARVLY